MQPITSPPDTMPAKVRSFACKAALEPHLRHLVSLAVDAGWRTAEINRALYALAWERLMVDLEPQIQRTEAMLRELGHPAELTPRPWLAWWLMVPVPALAGHRPLDLLDTADGRRRVLDALTQWISGVHM